MKKGTRQQACASRNELQHNILDLEFFRHAGLQRPDRAVPQSFQHCQKPSSIALEHLHQDPLGWCARPWSLPRDIKKETEGKKRRYQRRTKKKMHCTLLNSILTRCSSFKLLFCLGLKRPFGFLRGSYTERLNTITASFSPLMEQQGDSRET